MSISPKNLGFILALGLSLIFSSQTNAIANDCGAARDAFSLYKNSCGSNCGDLAAYRNNVNRYCRSTTKKKKAKKRKPASVQKQNVRKRVQKQAVKKVNREKEREIQALLVRLGYDTGGTKGNFGPKTCAAISKFSSVEKSGPFACAATVKLREALLLALTNDSKSATCKAFKGFDDAQLLAIWQDRVQKKIKAFEDGRELINPLITTLESDTFWVGGWREATEISRGMFKTVFNMFTGLLGAGNATRDLPVRAQRIFKAVEQGQQLDAILTQSATELAETALDLAVCKANQIGCIGIVAKNTVKDAIEVAETPEKFRETRKIMADSLKKIRSQMLEIEKDLALYKGYQKLLMDLKEARSKACEPSIVVNRTLASGD